MENIEQLRNQVKHYIDEADDVTIRMMYAMLEVQQQNDWWDELPQDAQKQIDKAINELDEGKGIPDEKVKEMYPQWFRK